MNVYLFHFSVETLSAFRQTARVFLWRALAYGKNHRQERPDPAAGVSGAADSWYNQNPSYIFSFRDNVDTCLLQTISKHSTPEKLFKLEKIFKKKNPEVWRGKDKEQWRDYSEWRHEKGSNTSKKIVVEQSFLH